MKNWPFSNDVSRRGSAAASSGRRPPSFLLLIFSASLCGGLRYIYIPIGERDLGVTPPLTKQSGKNGTEMADYFRRGCEQSGRRTAAKWPLSALK